METTGLIPRNVIEPECQTKKATVLVQQNSALNNELIRNTKVNDLYHSGLGEIKDILPTEVLVRGSHGKIAPIYTLCSFSYDENVDLDILNKKGMFRITAYDRRVYNAVSTIFLNGEDSVSLTKIYNVMTGYVKNNPTKKQIETIEKSLYKLGSVRVCVDLTEEAKANMIEDKQPLIDAGILKNKADKIKSAKIDAKMLYFELGTIVSDSGNVFKSIKIIKEPALLTYNRAKKTLLSVPIEYIGLSDMNATEKNIAFQDYLLMRIFGYKNGKLKENKILYETLYRDSGQEKPENRVEFARDREAITKILNEWKEKKLIDSYEETKEGRAFTGVMFYCD